MNFFDEVDKDFVEAYCTVSDDYVETHAKEEVARKRACELNMRRYFNEFAQEHNIDMNQVIDMYCAWYRLTEKQKRYNLLDVMGALPYVLENAKRAVERKEKELDELGWKEFGDEFTKGYYETQKRNISDSAVYEMAVKTPHEVLNRYICNTSEEFLETSLPEIYDKLTETEKLQVSVAINELSLAIVSSLNTVDSVESLKRKQLNFDREIENATFYIKMKIEW